MSYRHIRAFMNHLRDGGAGFPLFATIPTPIMINILRPSAGVAFPPDHELGAFGMKFALRRRQAHDFRREQGITGVELRDDPVYAELFKIAYPIHWHYS